MIFENLKLVWETVVFTVSGIPILVLAAFFFVLVLVAPFCGLIFFSYFIKKFKVQLGDNKALVFALSFMTLRVVIFFILSSVFGNDIPQKHVMLATFGLWCLPAILTALPEILYLQKMTKTTDAIASKVVLFSLVPSTIITFTAVSWASISCLNSGGC